MKLEIDHRNRNKRKKLLVETIQQATKKIMGHDKIKEECWKYLGITNNESTTIQNMGCGKNHTKREVHGETGLP